MFTPRRFFGPFSGMRVHSMHEDGFITSNSFMPRLKRLDPHFARTCDFGVNHQRPLPIIITWRPLSDFKPRANCRKHTHHFDRSVEKPPNIIARSIEAEATLTRIDGFSKSPVVRRIKERRPTAMSGLWTRPWPKLEYVTH